MTTRPQILLEIFRDILAASGNSSNALNRSEIESFYGKQANGEEDYLKSLLFKLIKDVKNQKNVSLRLDPCGYCDGDFRKVIEAYKSIHVFVTLLVCTIGVIANCMNVAVLTRKNMAAAPINRLLKWLAVADIIVMLEYVPFSIYRYLVLPKELDFPYSWAMYLLFHMHFASIMHMASICLTLSLGIWRYITIKYSDRSHLLCTGRRCSIAILTSFTLPPIFYAPAFMVFDINTQNTTDAHGNPFNAYYIDLEAKGTLYQANFYVNGVITKILPCVILAVISLWLIRALHSANRHQKNLRNNSGFPASEKTDKRQLKADKRTDRTTKMLLAVLLLFLVSELPNGILGLMSGLLGWCFFKRCYDLFGELMDLLTLLNGAFSFGLYCLMSQQFRQTFRDVVVQSPLGRWLPQLATHSD